MYKCALYINVIVQFFNVLFAHMEEGRRWGGVVILYPCRTTPESSKSFVIFDLIYQM